MRVDHFLLAVGSGVTANNSQQLQAWMKSRFHGNFTAVEVKGEGIGVAEFVSGVADILQRSKFDTMMFSGQPLKLLPAFLIWMPFSLPTIPPVSLRFHSILIVNLSLSAGS